jgi:hypothetical protein
MAAEQFANAAQSTLSSAITSAATSLQIDNASAFPGQGNFRILIDTELLLVTAVSGNIFTVSRAVEPVAGFQAAAAHGAGATVTHVLTAASVQLACLSDMLANLVNNPNSLSNPGGSTLLANTWNVISATASCNAKLPTPAAGKVIGVRIALGSTNLFTLNPNAAETIDGATSRILWAGESAILISEGTNWYKVAGKSIPILCSMYRNGNQTGIASATITQIALNATQADTTGLMADTGNNRINIKRTGLYLLTGGVTFDENNGVQANVPRAICWGQDNNGVNLGQKEVSALQNGYPCPQMTNVVNLNAGQYATLQCYHNRGANLLANGSTPGNTNLTLCEVLSW